MRSLKVWRSLWDSQAMWDEPLSVLIIARRLITLQIIGVAAPVAGST